jgi:hypothetical protein
VLAETDLKGMREFVAKYGDHMQPHLVDAIKGTMTDVQITDALMARNGPKSRVCRIDADQCLTPPRREGNGEVDRGSAKVNAAYMRRRR